MRLTQNRKTVAGSSIVLTACVFMFVAFGTLDRLPRPIAFVYLAALFIGGGLLFLGSRETARDHETRNESEAQTRGTV